MHLKILSPKINTKKAGVFVGSVSYITPMYPNQPSFLRRVSGVFERTWTGFNTFGKKQKKILVSVNSDIKYLLK